MFSFSYCSQLGWGLLSVSSKTGGKCTVPTSESLSTRRNVIAIRYMTQNVMYNKMINVIMRNEHLKDIF